MCRRIEIKLYVSRSTGCIKNVISKNLILQYFARVLNIYINTYLPNTIVRLVIKSYFKLNAAT